jgi:hypothetical protein
MWVKRCDYHLGVFVAQEAIWRAYTSWRRLHLHG